MPTLFSGTEVLAASVSSLEEGIAWWKDNNGYYTQLDDTKCDIHMVKPNMCDNMMNKIISMYTVMIKIHDTNSRVMGQSQEITVW